MAAGASEESLTGGAMVKSDAVHVQPKKSRKTLCESMALPANPSFPLLPPLAHFSATQLLTSTLLPGIVLGIIFALLASAGIVVGVLISQDIIRVHSASSPPATSGDETAPDSKPGTKPDSSPPPEPVKCPESDDIPKDAAGTWMDPTSWLDMTALNCTFTSKTVGDLPLSGLNSSWDDSARANKNVPPLDKPWGSYEKRPIRGVNLGGWLSLEPFITPSLFKYDSDLGIIDEYSLCDHLGPKKAAEVLEKHYATFITERDFKNIVNAGLDHIRIPFSYWAVDTFDNDPYVKGVSWRYLLRGIEWARKYGLRVKLDLHGLPGSQNGWNHSGRASVVRFLSGSDGDKNAKRALEIHDRLSKFFAQDRYRNVVVFYGLANEPARDIELDKITEWTSDAYDLVEENGVEAMQVFSDSMRGLLTWQGELTGKGDKLVIDTHVYSIFDSALISLSHKERISLACKDWSGMIAASIDTSTGFGPTMVGEWSQADTDCTEHLNGVGGGNRWEGTFAAAGSSPGCPTGDKKCSCDKANADPSEYSDDYRTFLKTWAIAQMDAYEKGWGWFYWTWKAEAAYQWSYEAGLKGDIMPEIAYERDWDCSQTVPSFGDLPEYY